MAFEAHCSSSARGGGVIGLLVLLATVALSPSLLVSSSHGSTAGGAGLSLTRLVQLSVAVIQGHEHLV